MQSPTAHLRSPTAPLSQEYEDLPRPALGKRGVPSTFVALPPKRGRFAIDNDDETDNAGELNKYGFNSKTNAYEAFRRGIVVARQQFKIAADRRNELYYDPDNDVDFVEAESCAEEEMNDHFDDIDDDIRKLQMRGLGKKLGDIQETTTMAFRWKRSDLSRIRKKLLNALDTIREVDESFSGGDSDDE